MRLRQLIVWCTVLAMAAVMGGCSQWEDSSISEEPTSMEESAPAPESAAEEPARTESEPESVNGMTSTEILALAVELTEKGNEVFWWYMGEGDGLEVEQTDNAADAVRKVGRFGTIGELKDASEAVFSKRFCEEILYPVGFNEAQGDNIKFREIDGALYINQNNGGMGWISSLSDNMGIQSEEKDRITVTMVSEELDPNSDELDATIEVPYDFAMVFEDGQWKLDNWYDYGTDKQSDTPAHQYDGKVDAEYTYDPTSGLLGLPQLGITLHVPPDAMAMMVLYYERVDVPSDLDAAKEMTIDRIYVEYPAKGGTCQMFSLSRWDAAEWDIPREYGLLPADVARSADGKWVILHAPSVLAAEIPADEQDKAGMQQWLDTYETAVVGSIQFMA